MIPQGKSGGGPRSAGLRWDQGFSTVVGGPFIGSSVPFWDWAGVLLCRPLFAEGWVYSGRR
jgi:hypothetical protein